GGTLIGLSKKLIGSDNIDEIEQLASGGNLENIDLLVGDMTATNAYDGMSDKLTAANFGNISGLATSSDIALGLFNMVYETVGVVSRFAARSFGTSDIVVTGNLTTTPLAQRTFAALSRFFSVNFIIPENSQFATVIGAALSYKK
ncbi:MAG: pantothenate kinase, partial [Firmicutes bacterium]|nr:pantothenate kinase [Bacillota bacterium]